MANIEYKAVIFDFNGTLFFDNDKHIKAWGSISKLLRGRAISEEELHNHINGVPNNKIVQYMMDGKATEDDLIKYSKLKEQYYREYCLEDKASFHLVKGAVEYFECLKERNIPFTIASASIKDNIDFFVSSFNLDRWINPDDIIYDDGTHENKVKMFKDAAHILGHDILEILIIEDSISGINNACEAGCNKIIVVDSANKEDVYGKIPNVIKIIKDFENICKM